MGNSSYNFLEARLRREGCAAQGADTSCAVLRVACGTQNCFLVSKPRYMLPVLMANTRCRVCLFHTRFARGFSLGLRCETARPLRSDGRRAPVRRFCRRARGSFAASCLRRALAGAEGFSAAAGCACRSRGFFLPRRDWMRAFFSVSCAAMPHTPDACSELADRGRRKPLSLTAHTAQPFLPIAAPRSSLPCGRVTTGHSPAA